MYAITMGSMTYHILYSTCDYTLCGLKAQRLDPSALPRRAPLHVVVLSPSGRRVCKECEEMEQRRRALEGMTTACPAPKGKSKNTPPTKLRLEIEEA
jgi:hypothetical protein